MTKRIALVIPTMDRGGAEKQLCLLAENLPRDQFDVHVMLLTRDGPRSQQLRDADIPVTVIGKRFKADPSAFFSLRRELRKLRSRNIKKCLIKRWRIPLSLLHLIQN